MENFLERLPFGCVLENYGSKGGPIQVPGRKNVGTELLEQRVFNLGPTNQVVRGPVGIEEFGSGQNFPQTLAEGAFAG
jgi:hypothetical protein